MSENYDVYKRRERHRRTKQTKPQNTYIKKLTRQAIVSTVCLSLIYFMEISNTDWGNTINNNVKNALTYEINTEGIQKEFNSLLDKIIIK